MHRPIGEDQRVRRPGIVGRRRRPSGRRDALLGTVLERMQTTAAGAEGTKRGRG